MRDRSARGFLGCRGYGPVAGVVIRGPPGPLPVERLASVYSVAGLGVAADATRIT